MNGFSQGDIVKIVGFAAVFWLSAKMHLSGLLTCFMFVLCCEAHMDKSTCFHMRLTPQGRFRRPD